MLDNIGDLSKPVTMLIEKVSNAVGVLYEPTRLRRIARAEVDAEKIKTAGRLGLLSDLQQRGLDRFIYQEGRKQANIESITAQAVELLPRDAEVEELEEDWVAHFFKQCDTVSDKEMQSLWAKLLSGEAARPGTFSKRTVNLVSSLDKKGASLFTALCNFNWTLGDKSDFGPLVYKIDDTVYRAYGINYASLMELDSIGLITLEPGGVHICELPRLVECSYFNKSVTVEFREASNRNCIIAGCALLTTAGRELAPISGSKPSEEFFEYIINFWKNKGLKLITSVNTIGRFS